MKRSLLHRRTPLRPAKPRPGAGTALRRSTLARRTRLRPLNPERRARLYEEQFGAHREFIVSLPCAVPGCWRRRVDPAHAKSRGAAGKAEHLVPLCAGLDGHHAEQHRTGIKTFEARYGLNLREIAASLWAVSPANQPPEPRVLPPRVGEADCGPGAGEAPQ